MRGSFIKGAVVGALAAAIVTMTGTAFAGNGIGAVFNIGKANTANRTSGLSGATSAKLLQVTNKGSGEALGLTVKAGKPPLAVNSTARVSNLNADSVDGIHASELALKADAPFRSHATISVPTSDAVELATVPGFGILTAKLNAYGGLSSPAFRNTTPEPLTVGIRTMVYTYPERVAPGETYRLAFAFEAPSMFDLVVTDGTRGGDVRVWWLATSETKVEVFADGLVR
jgi:hypothetical protein